MMVYEGIVVEVIRERGFGYIYSETLGQRIFFHISEWKSPKRPQEQDQVEFEMGPSPKPGKSDVAKNVRPNISVGTNALAGGV